jgi:hypothetical protein
MLDEYVTLSVTLLQKFLESNYFRKKMKNDKSTD